MSKTVNADLIIQQIRKKKLLTRDIGSQMFNEAMDMVIAMLEDADEVQAVSEYPIHPLDLYEALLAGQRAICLGLLAQDGLNNTTKTILFQTVSRHIELSHLLFDEEEEDDE